MFRDEVSQVRVDLLGGKHDPLAVLERVPPPERLRLLRLGQRGVEPRWKVVRLGAMDHVVLQDEVDAVVAHGDDPPEVTPPDPQPLEAIRLLLESGWYRGVPRPLCLVASPSDPCGVA